MIKIYELSGMKKEEKDFILRRARKNIDEIKKKIKPVLDDVKKNGDKALIKYTKQFDNVDLGRTGIRVNREEIKEAYSNVKPEVVNAIKEQVKYARKFHEAQLRKRKWEIEVEKGVTVGQVITPVECAGLYVPGGTAPYPTVMQILAVAAKTAGVPTVIACTPPRERMHELLVAADIAGVDEVYRVGGAQAIAAMAYGTETVPEVNIIAGPGNIYVTAAKLLVYGEVNIDMPAGPSEAIILADAKANPKYVAADILARAEHDKNAAGVLVTPSKELAESVAKEVEKQKKELKRREQIDASLSKYSAIIITRDFQEAIDFANNYAPEHLEVITKNPMEVLPKIKNAGSIFLGENAPVAVGDYASGVNHVLPTGGYAKAFSGVGVETFQKRMEFEFLTKEGLKLLNEKIIKHVAAVEGFGAHAKSVSIRFREKK